MFISNSGETDTISKLTFTFNTKCSTINVFTEDESACINQQSQPIHRWHSQCLIYDWYVTSKWICTNLNQSNDTWLISCYPANIKARGSRENIQEKEASPSKRRKLSCCLFQSAFLSEGKISWEKIVQLDEESTASFYNEHFTRIWGEKKNPYHSRSLENSTIIAIFWFY